MKIFNRELRGLKLFKEYEVKVSVHDINKISKRIKGSASLLKTVVQLDIYYDYEKTLFLKDEHFRLRVEYEQDSGEVKHVELAWKGPRQGKYIEVREDISVQILPIDLENLKIMLKKLEFKPFVIIKKIRERYRIDGIELEFDKNVELVKAKGETVPLGSFLQASVETSLNQDHGNVKKQLWEYLSKLGFKHNDWVEKSYIELALERLKNKNGENHDNTFPSRVSEEIRKSYAKEDPKDQEKGKPYN